MPSAKQPEIMQIPEIPAQIIVVRSTRKTVSARLTDDGSVRVGAPTGFPRTELIAFLRKHAAQINAMLQKQKLSKQQAAALPPLTYADLQRLADEACRVIPGRVKHYAALLGVTYGRITVRNQKTRWGSCSAEGNLNFNCLLMLAPPQVLDSVVVHELCHRLEMNHSKAFYAHVYRVFPEYDRWQKWLKENGQSLLQRMYNGAGK